MASSSGSTVAHPPPGASAASSAAGAAAAADSSAASAVRPVVDVDDAPPSDHDEDDIDGLVELEQSLQRESQEAEADGDADGGGGFEPGDDSGGGFFAEGETTGTPAGSAAAAPGTVESLEEDAPARAFASGCRECGSVGVQQNFLTAFNVSVCFRCQRAHPQRYALLTQTSCLHTYLLPLAMLQQRLGYIEKKNPHKQAWGSMKLYWKQQVLALVREKWGSVAALEAAKHARDVARISKDDARRRNAHKAAAREAAMASTVASSMGDFESLTPAEVAAMLTARAKGLAAPAKHTADKRRRSSKAAAAKRTAAGEDGGEEDVDEDEGHDPLAALAPPSRKRVKKGDSATPAAAKVKALHTHTFVQESASRRVCESCGFAVESEVL